MPTTPKDLNYEGLTDDLLKLTLSDFQTLINHQKTVAQNSNDRESVNHCLNHIYTLQMLNLVSISTKLYRDYLKYAFKNHVEFSDVTIKTAQERSFSSIELVLNSLSDLCEDIPKQVKLVVCKNLNDKLPILNKYLQNKSFSEVHISEIYYDLDYETGQIITNDENKNSEKAKKMVNVFMHNYPKFIFKYPKVYLPMLNQNDLRIYQYVFLNPDEPDRFENGRNFLINLYQFTMLNIKAAIDWWLVVNNQAKLEQLKIIELLYTHQYLSIATYQNYYQKLNPHAKRQLKSKQRKDKPTVWYWVTNYQIFNFKFKIRNLKTIKPYR